MEQPKQHKLPKGISPEREQELVFNSLPRRYRRKAKRPKQSEVEWPDITRGMSNHERMLLKKIGRGGVESRRRRRGQDRTK